MLGELIYQGSGKRTVRKILSTDPVKVEVAFEEGCKILGVEAMEIGTYSSTIRSDGTIYGEGEGIVMTTQGDQLTWKGAGAGTLKARGAVSYRGAIYYHTASPKFSRLNTVAGVFEFESDENGNTQSKIWEWK